jgi:hypothetical protein
MARRHEKTTAARIFENILFLEEVFGEVVGFTQVYR